MPEIFENRTELLPREQLILSALRRNPDSLASLMRTEPPIVCGRLASEVPGSVFELLVATDGFGICTVAVSVEAYDCLIQLATELARLFELVAELDLHSSIGIGARPNILYVDHNGQNPARKDAGLRLFPAAIATATDASLSATFREQPRLAARGKSNVDRLPRPWDTPPPQPQSNFVDEWLQTRAPRADNRDSA